MKASPILFHLTLHILFNSSTHRLLGLPYFLSHPLGYHSSTSILLATYPNHCYISSITRSATSTTLVMLLNHVFLVRSLLVFPSIHISMLLYLHSTLGFSMYVSNPYAITGNMHWSKAFFFKRSGMLDIKTMFILLQALFILRLI
jgi:hypothetical protein